MALQKLAKVAGERIAPHVPDLAAVLLESLSAHESGMASYAAQHVTSLGIDPAQLEAARVAASAASPASETLVRTLLVALTASDSLLLQDACVRYTTADTITALVARIGSLIQSGVGLPTRAATSRFLLSLIRIHRNLCEVPPPTSTCIRNSPQCRAKWASCCGLSLRRCASARQWCAVDSPPPPPA